ncbi:MAG: class I SAM-dependent methyltransferase [Candidatus Sericytochromatia bacterium]
MKKRSKKLEILDLDNIHSHYIFQNLKELEVINTYLGGFKISIEGLNYFINDNSKKYLVADLGCGGGDFLKYASDYFYKKNFNIDFLGYDLKPECISYAKKICTNNNNISLIQKDFDEIFYAKNKPDIVHVSLFLHHLEENKIINFIQKCIDNKIKLVINDLERHPLAYHSISIITSILSKSELVKNDAKLSVAKGFIDNDWKEIFKNFNTKITILKRFPFRYLILIE